MQCTLYAPFLLQTHTILDRSNTKRQTGMNPERDDSVPSRPASLAQTPTSPENNVLRAQKPPYYATQKISCSTDDWNELKFLYCKIVQPLLLPVKEPKSIKVKRFHKIIHALFICKTVTLFGHPYQQLDQCTLSIHLLRNRMMGESVPLPTQRVLRMPQATQFFRSLDHSTNAML